MRVIEQTNKVVTVKIFSKTDVPREEMYNYVKENFKKVANYYVVDAKVTNFGYYYTLDLHYIV